MDTKKKSAGKKFWIRENASRRSAPEFRQMASDELPTLRAERDAAKAARDAKMRELLSDPTYVALVAEMKRTHEAVEVAQRKGRYFRYSVIEDGGWCSVHKSDHDSEASAKAAMRALKGGQ